MNGFESALQIWADMYNEVDRKRFVALLENGRLKEENEELRKRIKELEAENEN